MMAIMSHDAPTTPYCLWDSSSVLGGGSEDKEYKYPSGWADGWPMSFREVTVVTPGFRMAAYISQAGRLSAALRARRLAHAPPGGAVLPTSAVDCTPLQMVNEMERSANISLQMMGRPGGKCCPQSDAASHTSSWW